MARRLAAEAWVAALVLAASGSAQTPPADFPGFAAAEAEMTKTGYVPLVGLIPPDVLVPRMVWQQAPLAGVPKAREALRLATRAERLGDWPAARQRWAALAADATQTPPTREEAALALVRLDLVRDPAAARAGLEALAPATRNGVGARILEGRLLVIEGKPAEALALLSAQLLPALRASSLHAEALADEMMLAALLAGERTLAERLASGGGVTASGFLPDLPLPRCHADEGFRQGDRAILELTIDPLGEISRATPVWASRPGPMAEALALRALQGRMDLERTPKEEGAFLRPRLLVGCAPHDLLANPAVGGSEMAEIGPDGTPRPVEGLRRFYAAPRAPSAGAAFEQAEAAGLSDEIRMLVLGELVRRAGPQPDLCGAAERSAGTLGALPLKGRLALAVVLDRCDSDESAARLLAVAADDGALAPADRRGVAARAASLTRDAALRTRMAAIAGLPADSCLLTDEQALKGLAVEAEDYPMSLRRLNIEAAMRVAFARAADGNVSGLTVLLAQPPLLFDPGTEAMLKRNRPLPARRDGVAVACSGQVTGVRWQLRPEGSE